MSTRLPAPTPAPDPTRPFVPAWREARSEAFDLANTSTAGRAVEVDLWGRPVRVYANANLSIYSGQRCNARCPFCVEELRPASRGVALEAQKRTETDDGLYFAALRSVLRALSPLDPSVSITGGEASLDPRLPRILRTLERAGCRKRTVTTNGSGLLDLREGRTVADWIAGTGVRHLNVSRAHPEQATNERLMAYSGGLDPAGLGEVVLRAKRGGTRVRLSCVLLREGVATFDEALAYLRFARSIGVDNVVFRQLMGTDPEHHLDGPVVRFSDRSRVPLRPLLDRVSGDPRFSFVRQVVGYYYYVEVWRALGCDIVFEEADLARLEESKRTDPGLVHELVFHPDGRLASTWQPWDGILGPPNRSVRPARAIPERSLQAPSRLAPAPAR